MIYGIGIDSVHIERMHKNIHRYGDRFAKKILSHREWKRYKQEIRPANFLAKHFAAKEAMAKALGTGFRDGLSLKHITVTHDNYGRPEIKCIGRASDLLASRNINSSYLSITDEKDYALACVVLEKVSA